MKSSIFIFYMLAVVFLLACHSQPMAPDTSAENTHNVQPIKQTLCSTSVPIRDKNKLKDMLTQRGMISQQMTVDEADEIVNEYIRKRQNGLKDCLEGKP